ncbi:hypothetical protein [Streptomyces avidinii]|uniref:Uncharacterized protein n=1 Tax=Streptomyces avidinii TaxID=1895 RepID=A0ABS4LGU4_STRAV|nr:hypothetical protein [Streptomyces avidinii]MBP2041347.1 hypothetical protein [Streptomyces avidinii]GGZ19329.1 hypothetical protein GCM10010343_53500 [Streptomyces avidinii]
MSDSLRELWFRGTAFNPAALSDVLIRLVDGAAGEAGRSMCEGRDLPDAVIDAALGLPDDILVTPDEAVRRAAGADPGLTPEALEALLVDPRTAEGAAANPSLPVARMHALLDCCSIA